VAAAATTSSSSTGGGANTTDLAGPAGAGGEKDEAFSKLKDKFMNELNKIPREYLYVRGGRGFGGRGFGGRGFGASAVARRRTP